MSIRLHAAYLAAKAIKGLSLLLRREGTSLPGKLALKLDPLAIRKVRSRLSGVVLVTGTNGKTTTTRVLAAIAEQAGFRVVTNSLGANMKQGIASVLLDRLFDSRGALGVIEVDEATLPKVIEELAPDAVVVTNFFRDQMDRYSELDHVVAKVKKALELVPNAKRVLNADDPLTRGIDIDNPSEQIKTLFYGMSPECGEKELAIQGSLDGQTCKRCGARLEYSSHFYGQLGDYRCACGFARPRPEVEATELRPVPEGYAFEAGDTSILVCSPGRYNAYNALAAIAGARAMGWPEEAIARAVARIHTDIGRMERLRDERGKTVTLTLVKNPTGLNQVLEVVAKDPSKPDLMIVLNDLAADGKDVSWIWDASLEVLERSRLGKLLASGLRSDDLAVRLKYAGLGLADLEADPFKAIDRLIAPLDSSLHLLTTYTSLYALRDHLLKKGFHHA